MPVSTDQHDRFDHYLHELELWNPKYNLVRAAGEDLVVRHILDCAAGAPAIISALGPSLKMIIDIGSGAGLPGIPLAILMPGHNFTLVERSEKRAGFLRNAVAATRLPNTSVRACAFESLSAVDAVVFRALHPFSDELLESLRSVLRPGGIAIAYKGTRERISEELSSVDRTFHESTVPVSVPWLHEPRHLVFLRFQGDATRG
jgi:16S rRNA (guanine527-N7)-methyltransferase